MGVNVSPIRQRRDHVIDATFITNVVLSVYSLHVYLCLIQYICIYIYIWTIYVLNIWIYLLNISTCAGGLSHRWFERESLIIQIRPYRLYVTNYKVYYTNGVSLSYRWKKTTENVNHKYERYHRCIWKMSFAKWRPFCLGLNVLTWNRLNDQLPRVYNKTSIFGTDWIKLTCILQV